MGRGILELAYRDLKDLNGFEKIPGLSKVNYLHLAGNKLSSLPTSLFNLKGLRELYISSNRLTTLPDIGKLTQLEALSLDHNEIELLPANFDRLEQLKFLDLSNNQIGQLPLYIGNLQKLTSIYLSNNQLVVFPKSFWQLNPQRLYLSKNKIEKLPGNIGNFTKLHTLDLSGNLLTKLPLSISNLRELRSLNLKGNPIAEKETIHSLEATYFEGNDSIEITL